MAFLLTSLGLLVLGGLSVAGFWYVEPTTPARIASLVFFLLITAYSFYTRRPEVLGSSVLFFAAFDINQYLFTTVLPLWLGLLAVVILAFLIWALLFRLTSWYLIVAAALIATELLLAMQYISLELKFQTLLGILPFIAVYQYTSEREATASQNSRERLSEG